MDFTRQPIIETIITPREGFRLVVRSSKNMGQEELFVDALEVVSFGAATLFFRSTERPKPFLVPASDYEVVEVREQRLVLKNPSSNSQEATSYRQPRQERGQQERGQQERGQQERGQQERGQQDRSQSERQPQEVRAEGAQEERAPDDKRESSSSRQDRSDGRNQGNDRRRDRNRRRRGGERGDRQMREGMPANPEALPQGEAVQSGADMIAMPAERASQDVRQSGVDATEPPPLFRTILPPPQTLIRDDLQRLRDNELYRGAFFIREEKEGKEMDDDDASLQSIDVDVAAKKEAPQQGESFRLAETNASEIHSNPPIPLP